MSNTKYCKVCHDTGKTESEYRSHYTRETKDPNSKILCPTLLAMECRYCCKKGHTVKYCAILKKNDKKSQPDRILSKLILDMHEPKKQTNTNKFAEFGSDTDSEDEEQEQEQKEEFPSLLNQQNLQPKSINFKAALEADAINKPLTIKPIIPPLTHKGKQVKKLAELDWATLSDSDEDEDEDEDEDQYEEEDFSDRITAWTYADKYDR
jgi:Nanos RNA binding domain